jgi:hypothetical protein
MASAFSRGILSSERSQKRSTALRSSRAVLGLGRGQQARGIKEPAQLLLGIKQSVAIYSQGQLPWGLGSPGLGIGY